MASPRGVPHQAAEAALPLIRDLQSHAGFESTGCDLLLSVYRNCPPDAGPPIEMSVQGAGQLLEDAAAATGLDPSGASCQALAEAIAQATGAADGTLSIHGFAAGLLALSTERWADRAQRSLCTLIAIEQSVPATAEEIAVGELHRWVDLHNQAFGALAAAGLRLVPDRAARQVLEVDEPGPLGGMAGWLAEHGLGMDPDERAGRVHRLVSGVARLLGCEPGAPLPSSVQIYDLKLYGGTPEGWDVINELVRPGQRFPQLYKTQLELIARHCWPVSQPGLQPLLCSFKARAAHFQRSVGIRAIKNRLYEALPDPKGVSKLITLSAAVLPIDTTTLVIEPWHWATIVSALSADYPQSRADLQALISLLFSSMDTDGDGMISQHDVTEFVRNFRFYGLKLIGGMLFEISFFNRELPTSQAAPYHQLAREFEKSLQPSSLDGSVEEAAELWASLSPDGHPVDGTRWSQWVQDHPGQMRDLAMLNRPELLAWLPGAQPVSTAAVQASHEVELSAVTSIIHQWASRIASEPDPRALLEIFSAVQVDVEALYKDPAAGASADMAHKALKTLQQRGVTVPYRFGLISAALSLIRIGDLQSRAMLSFIAIDQQHTGRVSSKEIRRFLESYRDFCAMLLQCLVKSGQLASADCAEILNWLDGKPEDESDLLAAMVDAVVCGLVQVVSIGKEMSVAEAEDEVAEGISMRTWRAWAEEHPLDLIRLIDPFS